MERERKKRRREKWPEGCEFQYQSSGENKEKELNPHCHCEITNQDDFFKFLEECSIFHFELPSHTRQSYVTYTLFKFL